MTVGSATETAVFRAYIEQALALAADDIVVMADFSLHKVSGIRESIAAVGLRLPQYSPYSPDYSLFESSWS